MKNFLWFDTPDQYRTFIYDELIPEPMFHTGFYGNLIEWIIDWRTPIFYEINKEYEQAHFTQYFNFASLRWYENKFVQSLYYLHDFAHMVFNNPLRPRDMTHSRFVRLMTENEFYAAGETEVLAYYRLPELRQHTIEQPILYDLLQRKGVSQPDPAALAALRMQVIERQPNIASSEPEYPEIQDWIIHTSTDAWCRLWRGNLPEFPDSLTYQRPVYTGTSYQPLISAYRTGHDFSRRRIYENNIAENVAVAYFMAQRVARNVTFASAKHYLNALENKIIMETVAKSYHPYYATKRVTGKTSYTTKGT